MLCRKSLKEAHIIDTENKKADKKFEVIIGNKENYDPMIGDGLVIDVAFILKKELEKERRKRRIKLLPSK